MPVEIHYALAKSNFSLIRKTKAGIWANMFLTDWLMIVNSFKNPSTPEALPKFRGRVWCLFFYKLKCMFFAVLRYFVPMHAEPRGGFVEWMSVTAWRTGVHSTMCVPWSWRKGVQGANKLRSFDDGAEVCASFRQDTVLVPIFDCPSLKTAVSWKIQPWPWFTSNKLKTTFF